MININNNTNIFASSRFVIEEKDLTELKNILSIVECDELILETKTKALGTLEKPDNTRALECRFYGTGKLGYPKNKESIDYKLEGDIKSLTIDTSKLAIASSPSVILYKVETKEKNWLTAIGYISHPKSETSQKVDFMEILSSIAYQNNNASKIDYHGYNDNDNEVNTFSIKNN